MNEGSPFHYCLKFIIIGDSGTGKSCIMKRFLESTYTSEQTPTIGVEFGSKIVEIGDQRVKLQLWDTAGQEQYQSVTRSYYRAAAGALVVYDVTNETSFNRVSHWLHEARELGGKHIQCTLVGNKKDLVDDRAISLMVGSEFAQRHDLNFYESSALSGEGIDHIFEALAKRILVKMEETMLSTEEQMIKNRVNLLKDSQQSSSCCGWSSTPSQPEHPEFVIPSQ